MSDSATREEFMESLAQTIITVAARHPDLRGPWLFNEVELQEMAARAKAYLAGNKRPIQKLPEPYQSPTSFDQRPLWDKQGVPW